MYYLKLGFVLFLIAAIASSILAFVNSKTQPLIEENQRLAQELARQEVLPEAKYFEEVSAPFEYFEGRNIDQELVGYTFIASETGYSGVIETMVGLDVDFYVTSIKVINQSETPGLGANCTRSDFLDMFTGKKSDELVVGTNNINITGATITARAITSSVKNRISELKDFLSKREDSSEYDVLEEAI